MQENQTFIKEKKKKISVSPLLFTTANKPNRMLTQGCAAGGQSGQSGIIMNANNITDRRGKSTANWTNSKKVPREGERKK